MMNNCEIDQLQIIFIGSGGGVDNHFLWMLAKFPKTTKVLKILNIILS
jgi:hypothetical protein